MTIEHGIVVGGHVIPNTERVIRDSNAWWSPGTHDARSRGRTPIRTVRGHWSAGTYREGEDAGREFFRIMQARKNDAGDDLHVSVHHAIDASGVVYQFLDHATASIDVGFRPAILDGVSVEVMWPGTFRQALKVGVDDPRATARVWDGQRVMCVEPTAAQLEAWRWLVATLCRIHDIPTVCAPRRRLTPVERARWVRSGGGVEEHGNMPGTTKIDACGFLLDATGYL